MLLSLASLGVISLLCIYLLFRSKKHGASLRGQHIMITGGSSGIGLAFATEAAERGASVSLIARNKEKLEEAKRIVQSHTLSPAQEICAYPMDVSSDSEELKNIVQQAEDASGPIFMLVNCAGTSVCHRFEETPVSELKRMMDVNYYGSIHISRIVVPLMKRRRKGKIVFFSSIAGLFGLYGYTAYSASKFAILGMAEALHMEVKPYDIGITVAFPPDTDTPGFAEEMKSKLPETNLVSEAGGLYSAKDVAKKALDDALKNRFMSTPGFQALTICTVCCGMTPASCVELVWQVLTMGIFRLIGFMYLNFCDRTIKKWSAKLIDS